MLCSSSVDFLSLCKPFVFVGSPGNTGAQSGFHSPPIQNIGYSSPGFQNPDFANSPSVRFYSFAFKLLSVHSQPCISVLCPSLCLSVLLVIACARPGSNQMQVSEFVPTLCSSLCMWPKLVHVPMLCPSLCMCLCCV